MIIKDFEKCINTTRSVRGKNTNGSIFHSLRSLYFYMIKGKSFNLLAFRIESHR